MVAIMTNSWLPKLYAFSAMWTLNTRQDIARSGGLMITSAEWRRYPHNVDLGLISGLTRSIELRTEVRTHAHTIQRAEEYNAEVFSPSILRGESKDSSRSPGV